MRARVDVDLEMSKFSGTDVAKREREAAAKEDGEPENPLDVARGRELAAERRLSLEFRTWAPHRQAAYVRRHGWPWEQGAATSTPYDGMSPEVAGEMLALMNSGKLDTFTDFWEMASDGSVRDKLEITAKGKR